MSVGIRTYPEYERKNVVSRRIANGNKEESVKGLGYLAAVDAAKKMKKAES